MSERRGTPWSGVLPSAIRQAASSGSALFLEPLTSILPLRRTPPRMRKLSIGPSLDRCPELLVGDGERRDHRTIGQSIGRLSIHAGSADRMRFIGRRAG